MPRDAFTHDGDTPPDPFAPWATGSAAQRKANGAAGVTLTSAADLVAREFKEPKWAVPQIVAEGMTILAGKPKTGKSWLALDFAVAAAGGYPALGNIDCQQGDVLLLALEDNLRRLNQRLKAVLQGQPAPAALTIATEWRRADAGGLDDLLDWLRAHHKTARLVVIDTLQMIRGQRSKSEGVYADDYAAIGGLKALADRSNVPFLAVHHLRKEAAGDPLESVSGTSGITGSADTILVLKREPKDTFGLLYVRGRDVPEAEIAMQFDEATGKWLRLTGADDFRRSKERRAIIRALIDAGEPMSPADIAAAIGMPRSKSVNIRMLLKKMREAGDVTLHLDGQYTATLP
jgi:AAA domain-containing protein